MASGSSTSGPADTPEGTEPSADLAELRRFESLVIDLAAGFVNLEPERVDQVIDDCLRRIVEALDLDRSTLAQRSGDDLVVTHSWARPGYGPLPKLWGRTDLPWYFEKLMSGESVVFSRVDELPAAAASERAVAQRVGQKSNATIPLRRAARSSARWRSGRRGRNGPGRPRCWIDSARWLTWWPACWRAGGWTHSSAPCTPRCRSCMSAWNGRTPISASRHGVPRERPGSWVRVLRCSGCSPSWSESRRRTRRC